MLDTRRPERDERLEPDVDSVDGGQHGIDVGLGRGEHPRNMGCSGAPPPHASDQLIVPLVAAPLYRADQAELRGCHQTAAKHFAVLHKQLGSGAARNVLPLPAHFTYWATLHMPGSGYRTEVPGWSMPRPIGRGAGLGNECIPWAKAYLGAQVFGMRAVHPAWGLNPRHYRHEFATPQFDWLWHRALTKLPRLDVTPDLVEGMGHTFDYLEAMRALRRDLGERHPLVITHQTMAGGYLAIRAARSFLRRELMAPGHGLDELENVTRGRALVVMHVRNGDFISSPFGPQPSQFNIAIPFEWYEAAVDLLRAAQPALEIVILSDSDDDQIAQLRRRVKAMDLAGGTGVLFDLNIMLHADLLVCSVSSLSMLAAFLSDKPYAWYAPHLHQRGGWSSIWGYEEQQIAGPTKQNMNQSDNVWGRGFPISSSDTRLNPDLATYLALAARFRDRRNDLIYYGTVKNANQSSTASKRDPTD